MTARTDHTTTLTPELGALAELIFLVELLLDDGFHSTDDNAATWSAFDEAMERGKQLVAERCGAQVCPQTRPRPLDRLRPVRRSAARLPPGALMSATGEQGVDVHLHLTRGLAVALAQACKRISWHQARELAVDDDEARAIIRATDRVRAALEDAGVYVR